MEKLPKPLNPSMAIKIHVVRPHMVLLRTNTENYKYSLTQFRIFFNLYSIRVLPEVGISIANLNSVDTVPLMIF